jgi:hypothetical protein
VQVPTKDGSTTMRNYSLSDVSGKDYFRISIKKEVYENRFHASFLNLQFFHKAKHTCGYFLRNFPNNNSILFQAVLIAKSTWNFNLFKVNLGIILIDTLPFLLFIEVELAQSNGPT